MVAPARINRVRAFVSTGRAAQAGWLLFTLLALSLALPGISPYRQLLHTICTDAPCLTGQLTSAQALETFEGLRGGLPVYAGMATGAYLLTYSLTLLTAAALIWHKPTHRAAVFGAFALSAAGTGTLVQATARTLPLFQLPAQLIHFGLLATLLPFFGLIPDGRFRPDWLRWIALAIVPAAALVAFDVVEAAVANAFNIAIATLILGSLIYRYRSLPASPQKEQVTWALVAAILLVGAPWVRVENWSFSLEPVPTNLFAVKLFGTFLLVGALTCISVAFLSDELFRVDVVLSRALVYSLLSLFVVAS